MALPAMKDLAGGPLMRLLQLLGLVAGGATALTGLAFAVGFLAVKFHDAMLGLVTTTAPSAYARTGIEFLPRSASAVIDAVGRAPESTLTLIVGVPLAVILAGHALVSDAPERTRLSPSVAAWLLIGLQATLSLVLLLQFEWYFAPLHSKLKSLLLLTRHPDEFGDASAVREVYDQLRASGNAAGTLALYGQRLIVVLASLTALVLLRRYRAALPAAAASPRRWPTFRPSNPQPTVAGYWVGVHDLLLAPAAALLVALMVLHLPGIYGVLAIAELPPCVQVGTLAPRPNPPAPQQTVDARMQGSPSKVASPRRRASDGAAPDVRSRDAAPRGSDDKLDYTLEMFLMSDLSSETKEVVLYERAAEGFAYNLRLYDRDSVAAIRGKNCTAGSIFP